MKCEGTNCVENSATADIMNIIANNVNDTQYPRDSCSVTEAHVTLS